MPNNESHYGSKEYQEQKKKFKQNTTTIIENIKKAAELIEVSPEEEKLQLKLEEKQSLTQLFHSIEDTITKIKKDNKGNELLYVPTYTPDDIRSQSLYGFTTICNLLKINYKPNTQNTIVIDPSISLDDFIKKFLSSEEALLNGKVIHLFYDRAHLEACIEQDTKIIFQNNEYYLKDILREMVSKCETDASVSETAKEQFGIRLKLCDAHLKGSFPSYYKTKNAQAESETKEDDLPYGYKQIKKIISNIESDIDKSLWTCSNLKDLHAEKDFLNKIIEFYDHSEGKLPLKKCLLLAKWHHLEGYQQLKKERGTNFFFNVLNEKTDKKPKQGPRLKNNASFALERVLHALLSDYKTMDCSYNALNELEISIDGQFFNITQILLHDPDFEHIEFTEEHLDRYSVFAAKKALNKPTLVSQGVEIIPSSEDYRRLDNDGECSHLHYAEKLAITIYSSDFFSKIQSFLRKYAQKKDSHNKYSARSLRHLVPEILLSTAIAAHGLAKPTLNTTKEESLSLVRNYRKEIVSKDSHFFKTRLDSVKTKSELFEKGFLSTSENNCFSKSYANTHTVFYEDSISASLGKRIASISTYRKEKEVLYGPGTQLLYTDYHREGSNHFFAVRPIRSIDGIKPNKYSNAMLAKHELEIIDKMFESHLTKNKHSRLRQLFDTVSNESKLKCVLSAKTNLKTLFDALQPDEQLNFNQLTTCQQIIETAIEENRKLVSSAFFHASLGKTDKVLQDALIRVKRAITMISAEQLKTQEETKILIQ
ncbi:hypothetical protein Lche_1549 [Legionella cherrii]|uniref:Uncharacterized protein n=1 Tax=Legionella cherrii TaxID=28084 RepID=A0A0W0S8T5_9GAMM|nr:hypothetical protein [Legionella cherrii]KTC79529.1 hypothetical protein Lche_1549 [Legionella cherrii]